jgi:hypothetical protein
LPNADMLSGHLAGAVVFLEFFRRDNPQAEWSRSQLYQATRFHGSDGGIPDAVPWAVTVDELFLVMTVHRFGRGITVGIVLASHGADRTDNTQPLRVADKGILNTRPE